MPENPSSSPNRNAQVKSFTGTLTAAHYAEIFGGFTSDLFRAFNARFPSENDGAILEGAIRVHKERLELDRFEKARYLLTDAGADQRADLFFQKVGGEISAKFKSAEKLLDRKIERRILTAPPNAPSATVDLPWLTYFTGRTLDLTAKVVVYCYAKIEDLVPNTILVLHGNEGIYRMLCEHFDRFWKIAGGEADPLSPVSTARIFKRKEAIELVRRCQIGLTDESALARAMKQKNYFGNIRITGIPASTLYEFIGERMCENIAAADYAAKRRNMWFCTLCNKEQSLDFETCQDCGEGRPVPE